ncbi:hypothetical protein J7E62_25710 [Variovorax paradoxus]|nr:hypothetical protein [Variovorax paradoxus]
MDAVKTLGLFIATALAEIIGCYLPYLWLKQGKSASNLDRTPFQSCAGDET